MIKMTVLHPVHAIGSGNQSVPTGAVCLFSPVFPAVLIFLHFVPKFPWIYKKEKENGLS